jgi:hypothetical protein
MSHTLKAERRDQTLNGNLPTPDFCAGRATWRSTIETTTDHRADPLGTD